MSMLTDLLRHRALEIDSLVGVVAELGRLTGIPTPSTDIVMALVRLRARVDALSCGRPLDGKFAARLAVGAN